MQTAGANEIQVLALVGRRGTGKSHHALLLAHQYNIEYIIDDGLLIKGNQILAGRSAKRENTRYGAVKRALFNDDDHARLVMEKIAEINPEQLLILGTSRSMAQIITERLGLPAPAQYISIEDIASPDAIDTALRLRQKENRHVIPLPTFAIKKDFPGYLIDPLRSFFSLPTAQQPNSVAIERSIIRPVYSTLGSFYITEHVVNNLVEYIASQIPGVHKPARVEIKNTEKKVIINVDLVLSLEQIPSGNLLDTLRKTQNAVKEQIEYLTGFYLDEVNVTAKKLHLAQEAKALPEKQ